MTDAKIIVMETANIDYRKDTPPVDWLSKKVKELRARHPNPPTHKDLGLEFMSDLLEELDSLRCQEPCPTQNGAGPVVCVFGFLSQPPEFVAMLGFNFIQGVGGVFFERLILGVVEFL